VTKAATTKPNCRQGSARRIYNFWKAAQHFIKFKCRTSLMSDHWTQLLNMNLSFSVNIFCRTFWIRAPRKPLNLPRTRARVSRLLQVEWNHYHDLEWPWKSFQLFEAYTSENIARVSYNMSTREPKSIYDLKFQLSYRVSNWTRTAQGHRQSRTL